MMKFSPEIIKEITNNIAVGMNQDDAAALAGVAESTFYEWKKTRAEFSEALKRALLLRKRRNVAIIAKAANTRWQAAAWKLEREFPEEFGQRHKHEIAGPKGGAIPLKTSVELDPKELQKLERLEKKLDSILRPAKGAGKARA